MAKFDLNDDGVVVIVGSGAGGGTLGNELAQKGVKTVILEAGPRVELQDFINNEWESFTQLAWTDMRTTSGALWRIGMKSMTRTVPLAVTHSVSSTSVSSTYARRVHVPPSTGDSNQWPASRVSRSAAKHAGESKWGKHNQSIEPSVLTSAAVCKSPISA